MKDPINHILQSDLSPSVQTLCVFVLNNADEDGWCRVSQSEIGEHLGVSQSAISRRESKTPLIERDGQRVRVTLNADSYYEPKAHTMSGKYESEASTYEPKAHSMSDTYESDAKDEPDSYSNPYEAAPAQTPSRKKKSFSTPLQKKNSTPPSDTPSLRSGVSGDGAQHPAELDLDCGLPEDDTSHPAVGIFRSKAQFHPSEYDRKRLIDVVGEVGTDQFTNRIGLWRKTVEEWRQRNYNWSNFDGLMDRYVDKLEAYGYVNRSDYDGSIELPEGEDVTAEEAGYAHLLEEG